MKMNKILAVLLSVAMLVALVPAFSLTTSAAVGSITNGDFETGDFTGWEYYEHSSKVGTSYKRNGSYGAWIGKDSSLANHVALEQVVAVNTGATYTLAYYNKRNSWAISGNCSFSVSVELGTTPTSFTYTALSATTPSVGNSFSKRTHSFSTSTYKYARIRFNAKGSGVDTCLDDISLTATVVGDESTHAAPTLTAFGTVSNWPSGASNSGSDPANCTNNVIKQPGFEATTNAQWNSATFLTNGVSVLEDTSIARSGSKCLKYYRGNVAPTTWSYFDLTLPAGGTYVFSAWVRTPGLAANNQGKASIGILDEETGKFLCYGNSGGSYDGHYSNKEVQIRSTATDDNWHLRSVVFEIGGANTIKIAMYGLQSTMYVDDISVHLLANGTTYSGNQTGTLSASKSNTNYYCAAEDSLIPDSSFNGESSVNFWSSASGWNNGFLEFGKDATDTTRKTSLHYKTTGPASNKKYRYVKFVSVEPNTKYFVSFDYRVVSTGKNLMFIDNNIVKNATFHTPELGNASNSWNTYTFSFNTGNYNRIGIVFQDGAGEAYYDNFRFFKDGDKTTTKPDEEVFPTLLPEKHPDGCVSKTEENSMDLGSGNGLAFRFQLTCTGLTCDEDGKYFDNPQKPNASTRYDIDYSKGKVEAFLDGKTYTLIKAGAVMTNKESVGTSKRDFTLDNLDGVTNKVIDIFAQKAWEPPTDETGLSYVVRIIKIPDANKSTLIYARPYYIFEYEGKQVTVYGDIVSDCYETYPDINDGWLEWD